MDVSTDIDVRMSDLYEQVVQLHEQGRYRQALDAASELCELARQYLPADDPQLAACLNNAAICYLALGNQNEAYSLYEEALGIYRKHLAEYRSDYAVTANNLAKVDMELMSYALAEARFREAIQIWREESAEGSSELAGGLSNLAALYDTLGRYVEAKDLLQQALEMTRKTRGDLNVDVANQLHNLAAVCQVMGAYADAEGFYQQSFAVMGEIGRAMHPDMATFLNNLAGLEQTLGKYAPAEAYYQQALQILYATMGARHRTVANTLTGIAELAAIKADIIQAEALYRQAQAILAETVGTEHPEYATNLSNLAVLYDMQGDYAAAERFCRQALDIERKSLGEQHPSYATTLNLLASICGDRGDYGQAEAYYQQALQLRRTAYGNRHPQVAESLNGLAELYREMGSFAKAKPLFLEALDIRRMTFGENHRLVAESLNNLGLLYHAQGDHSAADSCLRQALAERRAALGETHPDVAQSLHNLAVLYRLSGDYPSAEHLMQEALSSYRLAHLEQHPYFAAYLSQLAQIYEHQGQYSAAQSLYAQALDIYRASLGDNHPYVVSALSNLAIVYASTAQQTEAFALMQEAAVLDDNLIGQVFAIGSEKQRADYLAVIQGHADVFLSLLLKGHRQLPEAVATAFTIVLRRKAIGAEALAAQRDAILGGRYPGLEPQLNELTALRRQIAQKTLAGPGLEDSDVYRQLLVEWNNQRESLEAKLARQIPELNLTKLLRSVDLQAVAKALPKRSALIEFVRLDVYGFSAVPARGEQRWEPARYLAFVLPAGEPANLQMVDLGEADSIDQLLAAYRIAITGEREPADRRAAALDATVPERVSVRSDPVALRAAIEIVTRRIGLPTSASPQTDRFHLGAALRQALFDPLLPALSGCTRLFLAPDGDLARLPFEVLPLEKERYLIDAYEISYLSVGRDVLRFGLTSVDQTTMPLVIADPDFDLALDVAANSTPGIPFQRLAGTYQEGTAVGNLLGVAPLLGESAIEIKIKGCHSPRMVHIATHGFFLPDASGTPKEHLPSAMFGEEESNRLAQLTQVPNPLLRSGLALAGANTWLQAGSLPEEAEDGILTAEDVTGLDLQSTELVVLSACETGLGDIRVGEGVFGLRRAFVLAGAKTLVMSLWKVPDQQTQELMVDFYQGILAGKPRADALREAQLAMKQKASTSFYWGAFICQGDPGSLPDTPQPSNFGRGSD